MTAVVVVAHENRPETSMQEAQETVLRLRAMNNTFESIEAAFLELAERSIGFALLNQIDAGQPASSYSLISSP